MAERVAIDLGVLSRFNGSLKQIVLSLDDTDKTFSSIQDAVLYPMQLSTFSARIGEVGSDWAKSRETLRSRLMALQERVETTGEGFREFDANTRIDQRLAPGEFERLPRV